MTSSITYNDYKDVKGVKVPFNIIMSQGREIDIKVTDVKINEGVTEADFQ
jgi:zinc protease